MSSKQGVLSYRIESEPTSHNLTAVAGLAPYLDLIAGSGVLGSMRRNLSICGEQGWTDDQILLSLVLLNIAGGDCVDDLDHLNADEGLGKLLRWCENHGLPRGVRREMCRRWRKARERNVVSASAARRYLSAFHDEGQEGLRRAGKAFIPVANKPLRGLRRVNSDFVRFVEGCSTRMVATLDLDATLVETMKDAALFCYKGFRAYQPLNVWWAEHELMLHSEFRDGNVPAGYDQLRVLMEALTYLPESVRTVRLRSDTAGYEHRLLRWCDREDNKRFGRIEFVVSCDVTQPFKLAVEEVDEADWHPVYKETNGIQVRTGREWAEVCFVPQDIAYSSKAPVYRYLATREPLKDQPLPGMDSDQLSLPFQTMSRGGVTYKVFGVVTNLLGWGGNEVIRFHDARSGKCEEAHKILKDDFAGGKMPSSQFGANAAWWAIAILAMNLTSAMKRLVLGGTWANKRMKAIRFLLINVPGRIVEKARQLYLRLSRGHPALEILARMRERLSELAASPPTAG
jgi:hypothetical protein